MKPIIHSQESRRTSSESERCTLFVGDLSRDVSEKELTEVFQEFGDVVSVEIKRDPWTGNNLGYGFVEYWTREAAEKAQHSLQGFRLCSRCLRIGWAQKSTSLFVCDLDPDVTSEQLREMFSKFGSLIEQSTFVRSCNGFVRYQERESAEKAKEVLDGQLSPGSGKRPLRILWGDACLRSVFFQFDQTKGETPKLSEPSIRQTFSSYGDIEKVTLCHDKSGLCKGYGFIHFANNLIGEQSASSAIDSLDNTLIHDDILLRCRYSRKNARSRRVPKRCKKSEIRNSKGSAKATGMHLNHTNQSIYSYIAPVFIYPGGEHTPPFFMAGGTTYFAPLAIATDHYCHTEVPMMSGSSG